jgi:hypothetical protein
MKTSRSKMDRINLAMDQIKSDMKSGKVPESIDNFGDLHNYVDANYYGGFLEDDYTQTETLKFENEIQLELNYWLMAEDMLTRFCRARTLKTWVKIMLEYMDMTFPAEWKEGDIESFDDRSLSEFAPRTIEIWHLMKREYNNAI